MAKKDYSNLTKEQLIQHLEKLEMGNKYGLVWDAERVLEKVVTDCQQDLPVLLEVKGNEIHTSDSEPTHILIEGDNYHALSVLSYTHPNKIDLIYIDPPYNTGKPDNVFFYNDRIVDSNDSWRHSKWLNFMFKRLELIPDLMKPSTPIFISIDDNEVANLRLLCNKIFGEQNFIACLPTIMNLKGNQDQFGFAGTHEYTLVYCYDKSSTKFNEFEIDDDDADDWTEDDYGFFKKGANLKGTGVNAPRTKRPYLYYPILVDTETKEVTSISTGEYKKIYDKETKSFNDSFLEELKTIYEAKGFTFFLPTTNGEKMSWRWGRDKVLNEPHNIIITGENGDFGIYKKQRPAINDLPSKKPKTLFYKPEYSSGNGTSELKKIFGKKVFNNPKPVDLIKDFLRIGGNKTSLVLDFFAGSGTTAQAILELNSEDDGSRRAILCTNNENNICIDVTLPRIQAVIKGYGRGKHVYEAKGNNLKYFKTSFVKKSKNKDQLRINITMRCTEMLCLKEGIFKLKNESDDWKIFGDSNRYMAVFYDFSNESINDLRKEMNELNGEKVLYCFTVDPYGLNLDNFSDWNNIRLEPIPQKILEVYKRIFNTKNELGNI